MFVLQSEDNGNENRVVLEKHTIREKVCQDFGLALSREADFKTLV